MKLRSVSTASKIYCHSAKGLLNIATLFQIFGWCPDELVLPNVGLHGLRKLVGNMVAVPAIGIVELLVFVVSVER